LSQHTQIDTKDKTIQDHLQKIAELQKIEADNALTIKHSQIRIESLTEECQRKDDELADLRKKLAVCCGYNIHMRPLPFAADLLPAMFASMLSSHMLSSLFFPSSLWI